MDGRDILKQMAQQAKNRLRGKSDKITNIKNGKNYANYSGSNIKTVIISNDDVVLYDKIKSIKDDTINPLNELIDFSYYKTLNPEQKERYFFNLADKYRTLMQKYQKEKLKQVN